MNQYYLMAQLPALDSIGDTSPLPITEERFYELCSHSLGKKAMNVLDSLTLNPPRELEKFGNSLIDKWNRGERQLRLALGVVRAAKMNKSFACDELLSSETMTIAKLAVEIEDPMEAERFLLKHRIDFLESLRPMDSFSEEAVYYYGLKLKLMMRIRKFDESRGRAAYRNIYDSILRGDVQEAE